MGGKKYSPPKQDPTIAAYNNYLLESQKIKDADAAAAAEAEKAAVAGAKATGTTGYDTYRTNLLNQYNAGLIDSSQATQQLKDYEARYQLGTGYTQNDINSLIGAATQSAPAKEALLAGQTYKDILGREATQSEIANFQNLYKTGEYKLTDLTSTIKSGQEYQSKLNDNYLANYYDTMYGKQETTKSPEGYDVKTGKRTFNYNSAYDPTFSGDLGKSTGISTGAAPTAFTGTPAEIEEFQQAQRQKRDFMYNAGLTNLQGQIDKDTQKIKNEGTSDVARIGSKGQLLSNLTAGFWS
jgi:hypothetical protein